MKAMLRTLAELTLCPRWHREKQSNAVYLEWFRTVNNFITERRTRIQRLGEQIPRPIPVRRLAVREIPDERPIPLPEPVPPEPVRPVVAGPAVPRERRSHRLDPARHEPIRPELVVPVALREIPVPRPEPARETRPVLVANGGGPLQLIDDVKPGSQMLRYFRCMSFPVLAATLSATFTSTKSKFR